MDKGEIILYKPQDESVAIDVLVEDDTVWLTQAQMVSLFGKTKQNISLHINNAFNDGELDRNSVVKEYLTTADDGKSYRTLHYNLDVIISVGYRVKSHQGVQFRRWATFVLKDFMMRGYAVGQRFELLENRVTETESRIAETEKQIEFFVKTALPPKEGIFYDGQIFDAYTFASDLVKKAKKRIILLDNYVDETVLLLLSKRNSKVNAEIYTKTISRQLQLDLKLHNSQYEPITILTSSVFHDRFLIIDNNVYHIGASLKDLGKKLFAFSRMDVKPAELLKNI